MFASVPPNCLPLVRSGSGVRGMPVAEHLSTRGRLGWQNCPSTQGWRKPQRIRGYPPDMTRACRSGPLSTRPVGPGVPENGSLLWRPADLLLHARRRTLLADPQGRLLESGGGRAEISPITSHGGTRSRGAPLDPNATSGSLSREVCQTRGRT